MQDQILKLMRPEIVAMNAYPSARKEATSGEIWLNANESPWDDTTFNRYPDPQPDLLIEKLVSIYQVKTYQLLVTRGSDEGIDLLVRLFCRAEKDSIMLCPPTYGMYKVAANIQGANIVDVPLIKSTGFELDVEKIKQAWRPDVKLLFLCSPNNPTGNLLKETQVLSLCQALQGKGIVIVDEAYIEFSRSDSMARYIELYPNLVVLRTLSKAYGLAGIRCGITLANPIIIQLLKKIIAPYPIPTPVSAIACQKITLDVVNKKIEKTITEREKIFLFLKKLPYVRKVWKSDTNFLLFEVDNANHIMKFSLKKGIVLRNRSNDYDLNNCLRVTIGSESENKKLMEVMSNVSKNTIY